MHQKTKAQSPQAPAHIHRHLHTQSQSGLSVQQYCREHSLSPWSFYHWRKRYQTKRPTPNIKRAYSFTEVGSLSGPSVLCEVRFPTGVSVTIHQGVPAVEVAKVLRELSRRFSC